MVKRAITLLSILLIPAQVLYSEVFELNPGDKIQTAVDAATDGDTIILNPGSYTGTGNYNIAIKGKTLTITTPNPQSTSQYTIISAGGSSGSRIFKINQDEDSEDTNVTLEGLYLSDATIHAVICEGLDGTRPELTMRYCNVSNSGNSNMTGGIVVRNSGTVTLSGCAIENNETGRLAAGIYAENCEQLEVVKTVIRNNTCTTSGSIGGGIYIYNSTAYFDYCFIYGNSTIAQGGAVYIDNSGSSDLEIAFYNCVISGNSANSGGGIYSYDVANPQFINCIFYGNKNYGLVCKKSNSETLTAELKNSIIWANETGQIYSPLVDIDVSYCFVEDGYEDGRHIFTEDPDFKEVGEWNDDGDTWTDPFDSSNSAWRLNFTSPCIDSGDPNYLPLSPESKDIDGDDRFIGFTVDPGIDEYSDTDTGKVYNSTQDNWYGTIEEAMAMAYGGDELLLSPGLYNEYIILTSELNGITISGFKPYNDDFRQGTIIDGSGYNEPVIQLFEQSIGADTTITGLTIKGGIGLSDALPGGSAGGGIYCKYASPTISHCRIEENSADIGGGIAVIQASPRITGCIVINNTCEVNGSGIAVINNSSPQISNCAINENVSGVYGDVITGGLYFDETSYPEDNIIRNCLFRENQPHGLYYENIADLEINSTIFDKNTDPNFVVDLFATNDNITLNYCDFVNGWDGPGIENTDRTVTFNSDYKPEVSYHIDDFINSGDPEYEPGDDVVDIDGNQRKLHCRIDIGPYEIVDIVQYNRKNAVIYDNDIYCTIQEAIDEAEPDSYISLSKGIYKENVIIDKEGITLKGSAVSTPEDIEEIVIDGSYKTIPDLTDVSDPNDPNYQGAAITLAYGQASDTLLQFITLKGGWGSLDSNGKLNGGGISSQNNDNIRIENCVIKNSTADNGGGIYIKGSDMLLILENLIYGNSATENGGGINIVDCEESYIANCQITKNQSDTASAFYSSESKTSIDFCTIADNTATSEALILTENPLEDTAISNSIIYNNSPQDLKSSGNEYDIIAEYCCIPGYLNGKNNISDNPLFLDTENNNYQLSAYSPCVNAAYPAPEEYPYTETYEMYYYKNTLQDTGETRIAQAGEVGANAHYNPNYDMGAYEVLDLTETLDHDITPVALYYVIDTTEEFQGNFSTISDAINSASHFYYNIIELEPGLYDEQVRISVSGITIRSKMESKHLAMPLTIIKAEDDGDPAIILDSGQAWDVTLEGMTIVGGGGDKISSDPNSPTGGGGIYSIDNSGLNLKWCTIAHNTADLGGGIMLKYCDSINMEHCLINSNTASRRRGGGIYLENCFDIDMNYCTITSNTSSTGEDTDTDYTQTGGIYLEGTYSNVNIKNSIIWSNTPTNVNKLGQDDSDITYANCVIPDAEGTDIIETNPYFGNASIKEFHLRSPAGRYMTWYRQWTKDANTNVNKSPAIDAADGTSEELATELFPAGANTNIGVYGASPEASLSYKQDVTDFDIADINGDYIIDYIDLIALSENWLNVDCFTNIDRDNDCLVSMTDLIQIAANWQTADEFGQANINNDEAVDISDFAILTENWHSSETNNTADRNQDGIVDLTDLEIVVSQWLATQE